MNRPDITEALTDLLGTDVAEKLSSEIDKILDSAVEAFNIYRSRTLLGSINLVVGESVFSTPDDFIGYKSVMWGAEKRRNRQPWDPGYPRSIPRYHFAQGASGYELQFALPISAGDISQFGSSFKFYYFAAHKLAEEEAATTIAETDKYLFLLRAQAEAMRLLALISANQTVSAKNIISGALKNGTPAALHELFMKEFMVICRA